MKYNEYLRQQVFVTKGASMQDLFDVDVLIEANGETFDIDYIESDENLFMIHAKRRVQSE